MTDSPASILPAAPAAPAVRLVTTADTPWPERLRRERLAQGLTQGEVASRVGMTRQTLSDLERGRTTCSRFLPALYQELGIPLDELPDLWKVGRQDLTVAGAEIDACASTLRAGCQRLFARTLPAKPLARPPRQAETPEPTAAVAAAARDDGIRERLDSDYEFFAAEWLRIRSKEGPIVPLVFNRAQQHIHAELEAQRARTGRMRALILKGRQQGCSTYVSGRFYHRASRQSGLKVFILSHEELASENLFEIVARFHELCPQRPSTSVANASELYFDALHSGYRVGTARTKGVGRSSTVQLFHGSEVALWPHAQAHAAGLLQAVPNAPGTEVILESTGHGVGNLFHKMWRAAENRTSEYIAIFVPWYWQEEYRDPVADGFALDAEERDYAALYGLDDAQMAWRRSKIAELGDATLFKQEYPANAAEAFQMTGHDSFIPPELIARARKAQCEPSGPLVIGYDPAWKGGDRHAMAWRRGRCVIKLETRMKLDTVEAAGWVKRVIDTDRPQKLFIDIGGVGCGVGDQLRHMGEPYCSIVEEVNFGMSPSDPPPLDEHGRPSGGPLNRRAEIWMKSKEWLEEPAGVQIPDSDSLHADACGPSYRYDSLTRLVLESKDDMRRRGALSPDEWDAVALTFAGPVVPSNFNRQLEYPPTGWM